MLIINNICKINLEKHIVNVTFHLKRCGKDNIDISLDISNLIPKFVRPMSILRFSIFFNSW